ncbi:MAG TPA: amidohydrolase [Spirochaetes bacterium]|nr:amidohydrolase [Spirochaetota bacterium]
MVIDCHFHLEEELLTIDELTRKMDDAGVERVALMASMCEPFPEPARFLVGLLQYLLTHGYTRPLAKLLVANFTADGNIKLPAGEYRIHRDPDNAPVFDTVKKYPGRFLGWVFVNPRGDRDPVEEIRRWKDTPGFIGVKAHPFWHRFTPVELEAAAGECVKLGKPMLLHVGFGDHGDFASLLKRVPELKLVLAHAGFPRYADTWAEIKKLPNVWVDLSQTSYTGEKTTRDAVDYLGAGRCLFGTDGPFGFQGDDKKLDYGYIKARIERLFPDPAVSRRLLGENFAELAGIA